jgi:hypothetical protein
MKIFKIILAIIAIIYLVGFTFNHINPWLAIGVIIATIYITIKQFNKKRNEQD